MSPPSRMRFGIFLAPFHRLGENPTLAIDRDLELIQWLDQLGFDEAWIGEHHSAGWETIASPEIFIATAAERTRHIRLGTGVVSLPYHHPLMVANRMVLLDHLTRGRVMLGVGPGALTTDAIMLGIEPSRQRQMMSESLDVIVRLMTDPTPLTYKSDWFQLNEALLQLRPYTQPYLPLAVASMESPAGMVAAGRHGAAVLSLSVFTGVRGKVDLRQQWRTAEETAAEHGKSMSRDEWSIVTAMHLAEDRQQALDEVRENGARFVLDYMSESLGRPAPDYPSEEIVDRMVEDGSWIVGTPDDCIAAIDRLQEITGGFGGLMITAQEWTSREKVLKSYELLARYVMPRFQGTLVGLEASNAWARRHAAELNRVRNEALEKAHAAHPR